jgi:predicted lipoprotein with Yx(FWY)xxD motif
LTLWIGLFGFREVRTTAGIVAGVIEVAAFAALALFAAAPGTRRAPGVQGVPAAPAEPAAPAAKAGRLLDSLQAGIPGAGAAAGALAVLAVAVLSISVAAEGATSSASSAALLKVREVGGVRVVTNARGYTLYWFGPDTATKSNCSGSCVAYWPPVTGSPAAGPGVTGTLGSIRRSGGITQATYDRHPLYAYVGDSAPGQANGNNLNVNGGVWHEMTVSG